LCGSTFRAFMIFGLEYAGVGSSSEGDVFAFVPTTIILGKYVVERGKLIKKPFL
jgi:hypothetical protein